MNVKHDREKVIQTASGLFSEKGYTALGVDEIIKKTGMTKGAFYNAFGSKEAFLLEALTKYSESNTQRIERKLQSRSDLKAAVQLEQFYLEMLDMQDQIEHKGCLINNMMTELSGINENVTCAINSHFDTIIENLIPIITQGQAEGDLKTTMSAQEMAELIHSSFYGILNRLKSKGDTEASKKLFKILISVIKN